MKKNRLIAIGVMIYINGLLFLSRKRFTLPAVMLSPLSFLLFIYIFGGTNALSYAATGGLIYTVVNSAFYSLADISSYRIDNLFQDMIVASPISLWAYLLGVGIGDLFYVIPSIALFLILLNLSVGISVIQELAVLTIILMIWLFLLSIIYPISQRIEKNRDLWPVVTFLSFFLVILPPVFYPYSYLPTAVRFLALISPTSSASYAISGLIHGFSLLSVTGLLITILLLISAFILLILMSRRVDPYSH
jgi:ABC-2 type transport system permease protein